jgi:dedicated sortase system histidine kinase
VDASDAPTYAGATVTLIPRLGKRDRQLYVLAKVLDDHLVYRGRPDARADSSDRVELATVDPQGRFVRYTISAMQPGNVPVLRTAGDGATPEHPVPEPRAEAFWRETKQGYTVELRMPLALIGARLGLQAASVDDNERRETTAMAGPTGTDNANVLAPVLIPEAEIDLALQELSRSSMRIWVVDRERHVLAQSGTLRPTADAADSGSGAPGSSAWRWIEQAVLRRLYSQVFPGPRNDFDEGTADPSTLISTQVAEALNGSSTTRWRATADQRAIVLSAARPISAGTQIAGAVVVEETTNAILSIRTSAMETLFTTALIVMTIGALTLFVFATRLSTRIRRLRDDAEEAVDAHGRVRAGIAASAAEDEVGDLSRSLSTMVKRLGEYHDYLESMSGRLAHEIRTPIAVVRSSLDNLNMQPLPDDAKRYMDRAREGLTRLSRIVAAMTEATRLEQILQQAERERFDLNEVIAGCVSGYRLAYPQADFKMVLPEHGIVIDGAPELIAQLLDKLTANAIDFAQPGTPIELRVQVKDSRVVLSVANEGPLLPESMHGRLFDSMVSIRAKSSGEEPHLGMGLYIVRLIAGFHGGTVRAANNSTGTGVVFAVELAAGQPA